MNLKKLLTGNSRLSEIVRFALVGGLATVLQYGFYIIFVHAVGVPAVPSTMISYALSFIVNYILSSYFTFHTKPTAKNGLGFTLSHLDCRQDPRPSSGHGPLHPGELLPGEVCFHKQDIPWKPEEREWEESFRGVQPSAG